MKRHTKTGLITFVVALVTMSAEAIYHKGFSVSEILAVLWKAVTTGLVVGIAVYFMDKKD